MEAVIIQSNERAIAASNAANTARFKLPRRMCEIARPTSKGCLVDRSVSSLRVTGSVSRNSISQKKTSAHPTAPTVQRQVISARVSEGRRKLARKPSSVGEMRGMNLSHHDVHELTGDVDCFHDLLAGDRRLHFLVGQRAFDHEVFGSVGGDNNSTPQLAVDLYRDFKLFFFGERGVVLRPGRFEQVSPFSKHFPEFVSEVGSEGCEQQREIPLDLG